MLGQQEEIEATPAVLREHGDVLGRGLGLRALRQVVLALVHQDDGRIRQVLPLLEFELPPAELISDDRLGLEAAIEEHRTAGLELQVADVAKREQGLAGAVASGAQVQHRRAPTA